METSIKASLNLVSSGKTYHIVNDVCWYHIIENGDGKSRAITYRTNDGTFSDITVDTLIVNNVMYNLRKRGAKVVGKRPAAFTRYLNEAGIIRVEAKIEMPAFVQKEESKA